MYIDRYIHIYMHKKIYIDIYVYLYTYIYIYIYICIYIYVYMHVYRATLTHLGAGDGISHPLLAPPPSQCLFGFETSHSRIMSR